MTVKSDIEIAREAKMKPIGEVGSKIGVPQDALLNYGPYKAKISFDFIEKTKANKDGKLILLASAFFMIRAIGSPRLLSVGTAATLLVCAMAIVASPCPPVR